MWLPPIWRSGLEKRLRLPCSGKRRRTSAAGSFTLCYDPEDAFFYDVDKNGTMRRIKTVAITNVLHEGVAEEPLAREIFLRHLWNEREFKVPYPFPGGGDG